MQFLKSDKNKILLILIIFILAVAPVYADDLQDGLDAYERKDYKTAFEKLKPLAEQGNADAQMVLDALIKK